MLFLGASFYDKRHIGVKLESSTNRQSELLAQHLGSVLSARGWRVATAESCTGGGVAAAITSVAGSSGWFECGVVSYGNNAKQKLLGVSSVSLDAFGAVSEAVVKEMAAGVLGLAEANIAVAISGIAGPSGGGLDKPVGTVWFAWATAVGDCITDQQHFSGDRSAIQQQAVIYALEGLLNVLNRLQKNTV